MAITGKGGSIKIGAVKLSDIQSWKLDMSSDMKDVTDFDSNGWKEQIAGNKSWGASADGYWNIATDTTGQKAIQDAFLAGTSISLELNLNGTNKYSGTAYINKVAVDEPNGDVVKFTLSFEGTAALVYA